MRVVWCDVCGGCFDAALPVCRQVGCAARVCRHCRDDQGVCLPCVAESAHLATDAAARVAADRDALIGVLIAARRCNRTALPADDCPCADDVEGSIR